MATYQVANQSQLNAAVMSLKSGDTLLLASGNYAKLELNAKFAASVTIASIDKTNPAAIAELKMNGAANITFDGLKFDHTGRLSEAFKIENSSKISIKNSTFDGHISSDGFGSGHGLQVRKSSDITIQDNKSLNFTNGMTFSNVDNLVVKGNDMSGMSADSMRFSGITNGRIESNKYHSQKSPADLAHKDAIQFWTSSTEGPSKNIVITGNEFDNKEKTHTIYMGNALAREDPSKAYLDFLIENNVIKGGHAHGISIEHVNGAVIRGNVLTRADGLVDKPLLTPIIHVGKASVNVTITGNEVASVPAAMNSTWNVSGNKITDTKSYLHWYGEVTGVYQGTASETYKAWTNHAPVLVGGGVLASVGVNATEPVGAALKGIGIIANDAADGGEISGYAIVGNAASSATQGVWQYSTNAGGNWHAVGQVDEARALALSAETLIRFVPAAGFVGSPAQLTVRALDDTITRFTASGTAENRSELDARINGGITGISAAAASIETAVDSVFWGGDGNDAFTGSNGVKWALFGGMGNDRLAGADLADVLHGGGGDDLLTGHGGDDFLFGNEGADVLVSGFGDDVMRGGAGNDTYHVGQVDDQVIENAGEGVDLVNSWVTHTLTSNVENLTLLGSGNVDGVGNAEANALRGNAGNNVLRGGEGNDTLTGDAGNDTLIGDGGNDVLLGGLGKDVLNGGLGADAFVFWSVAEAGLGTGRDVVQNFQRGVDKIDLVGIDANTGRSGDQAFKFIGSSALSGSAGELRYNAGMLTGDVDGDGRADFMIEVGNLATLSQTDLLL